MMRSRIVADPRRPGRRMALVGCWCGRVYTLTAEEIDRHRRDWTHPCPEAGAHHSVALSIARAAA